MNIKIFVSFRNGVKSKIIPSTIYYPVLCGKAISDDSLLKIDGDDSGDNISYYRNKLGELTVQYWAWKNFDCDYYGLCHYHRYLSFTEEKFKLNRDGLVTEFILNHDSIEKYNFHQAAICNCVDKYDAVVNKSYAVNKLFTPRGHVGTEIEFWKAYDGMYIDNMVLNELINTIKKVKPELSGATDGYMNGKYHRGYNCYVMRKDLFYEMCEFQFNVIFLMEEKIKQMNHLKGSERTLGYLGEIMYGIYVYYLQQQGKYKIKELQLVYFEQTELPDSRLAYWLQKILYKLKFQFEDIGYVLLPKGSPRRNFVKKIYFALTGKNKNK